MGKLAYNLKNLFKSKEQIELEARMQFNQNKRAFNNYYRDLGESIKRFSKMAQEAELSGNHVNALSCAKFVLKLQSTQTKVQGLLQRFEMMYSMQKLTGVMSNFMTACANMGFNMDANIDLKRMWKDNAAMDKAISKLDAMSDQMDMVFDTIDAGMNNANDESMSNSAADSDEEASKLLNSIMGRHNAVHYNAEPDTAQAVSAPTAEQEAAPDAAADDTDERLRKMMQDLKG